MLFKPTAIVLSLLVSSAHLAPTPSDTITNALISRDDKVVNSGLTASDIVKAVAKEAAASRVTPRDGRDGVLTASEIVEAVAKGLGIDTKAGGIVQAVADGLKAGGSMGRKGTQ